MRVENEKVVVDKTTYICETCGHKSTNRWDMEAHEKIHLQKDCKHLDCRYSMTCDSRCDDARISKQCRTCGLDESVEFSEYHDKIAEVFALLKGG